VTIVDPVLRHATQPFHRLHQRTRVPHLDDLGTDPRLDPLPPQTRRHRVGVLLHLDRRTLAHPHALTLQRFQPTLRQRTKPRLLLGKRRRPARVPPGHQGTQELPVVLPAGEVPTATQKQLLLQGLLETPMALLAIPVLMAAVGVRGFRRHPVVTQQRLIPRRVLLGVAVVVHRQRHAVRAMTPGHTAQVPQGILQAGTEAGETLRKTDTHVLPVRAGQHEVVQQVRKRLSRDSHAQALHVREVRRPQPARLMHLAEEHFLGRPVLGTPLPHAAFHRPPLTLPVLAGTFPLQPVHQGLGLQRRLTLQQLFQPRPDVLKRIDPGTPGVGRAAVAGPLAPVAVLACGLAIHASLHRRVLQRCPPVQVTA
jgi:hypothetical protein